LLTGGTGNRQPSSGGRLHYPFTASGCSSHKQLEAREREREFYSQLHCRHTRRAISPSKLVLILSNTYNEQYTKENIHRQRRNRQYGKKQMKKKQIVCTYNNETSKDYKQYTILSMIILLPIILISSYGLPVYSSLTWPPGRPQVKVVCHTPLCVVKVKVKCAILLLEFRRSAHLPS